MRPSLPSLALFSLSLTLGALTGCTVPGQSPGSRLDVSPSDDAMPEFTIQPITPDLVRTLATANAPVPRGNPELEKEIRGYEYKVGPQDVLTFTVWDHPELTIPAGEYRSPEAAGHKVDNQGRIFFPYVGEVAVAGRTLQQIRVDLTEKLGKFVTKPQLDVRVADYRSQKVLVSGEVKAPGTLPISEAPLTLAQAINLLGGTTANADLRSVILVRNNQPRRFDLQALLDHGDATQNLVLRDGDMVNVPDTTLSRIHVIGEVKTPGTLPMLRGTTTLADAIGSAGGFDNATSDAGRIFLFRGTPDKPDVFWLDARSPETMLLAAQFPLQPLDVVYVARTSMTGYNRVISQILPTIQALYQLAIIKRDLLE